MSLSKEQKERRAKKLLTFAKAPEMASFDTAENLERLADAVEGTQKVELMGAEIVTIKGQKGDKGEKGEKGDKGERGEKGDKGDTGEQGPQGIQGEQGEPGAPGWPGLDGDDGKDGEPGPQGPPGVDGSPDTPEDIRRKLEILKGDNRLDASAVKNIDRVVTSAGGGGGGVIKEISAGNDNIVIDNTNFGYPTISLSPKITVSATEPSDPTENDLWVDIS